MLLAQKVLSSQVPVRRVRGAREEVRSSSMPLLEKVGHPTWQAASSQHFTSAHPKVRILRHTSEASPQWFMNQHSNDRDLWTTARPRAALPPIDFTPVLRRRKRELKPNLDDAWLFRDTVAVYRQSTEARERIAGIIREEVLAKFNKDACFETKWNALDLLFVFARSVTEVPENQEYFDGIRKSIPLLIEAMITIAQTMSSEGIGKVVDTTYYRKLRACTMRSGQIVNHGSNFLVLQIFWA